MYRKGDLSKYLKTINGKNGWTVNRYGSVYEVFNAELKLFYRLQQRTKLGESYIVDERYSKKDKEWLHYEIDFEELKKIINT